MGRGVVFVIECFVIGLRLRLVVNVFVIFVGRPLIGFVIGIKITN